MIGKSALLLKSRSTSNNARVTNANSIRITTQLKHYYSSDTTTATTTATTTTATSRSHPRNDRNEGQHHHQQQKYQRQTIPRPRPRPSNRIQSQHNNIPAAQISEGIILSQEQIERIWNSYQVEEEEEEVEEEDGAKGTRESFNMEYFCSTYPHVNPSLKDSDDASLVFLESSKNESKLNSSTKENKDIPSSYLSSTLTSVSASASAASASAASSIYIHHPIAEEAEEKLNRMLTKIKSHQNLPSAMYEQIQNLLQEEVETVIDLWIRISNDDGDDDNFDNHCQEVAIAATDKACNLLLQYETQYMQGIIAMSHFDDDDDDDDHNNNNGRNNTNESSNFYPSAPKSITYQKIISNYYEHSIIDNNKQESLSQSHLDHVQAQCLKLIKKMMKDILSKRMYSLKSTSDDHNEEQSNTKSGQSSDVADQYPHEPTGYIPLNETYNQLIFMYTSTQHAASSYTHVIEMTTMASKLLQEMELYYHDFITTSTTNLSSSSSSSSSTGRIFGSIDQQTFLISIYPMKSTFDSVIFAYARIASKFNCIASARKTSEIVTRMEKRYSAYVREADNVATAKIMYAKEDLDVVDETKQTRRNDSIDTVIHNIFLPDMETYMSVLGAFASLDTISGDDLEDVLRILNVVEDRADLKVEGCDIYGLVKICWKICNDLKTKTKVKEACSHIIFDHEKS